MRAALVGDTMPPAQLMSAMSIQRTTQDSARIAGALTGAGLVALLGMGPAYLVVAVSICDEYPAHAQGRSGARRPAHAVGETSASPWRDLREGARLCLGDAASARRHVPRVHAEPDRVPALQRIAAVRGEGDFPAPTSADSVTWSRARVSGALLGALVAEPPRRRVSARAHDARGLRPLVCLPARVRACPEPPGRRRVRAVSGGLCAQREPGPDGRVAAAHDERAVSRAG